MSTDIPVERISTLVSAAAAVVGEVDLDRVLRRLVAEARARTGARYAALGVIGPHGVLSDFIHEGMDEEAARDIGPPPRGRGLLGKVVREQQTIVLDDIASHPDAHGVPEGHPQMSSFLGVPITSGSNSFGNLYLTNKDGGFTDVDVEVVEALATIAGAAVSTARLRDRLKARAIVEDRDRIARDLHDSVIQDLFAIGLSLQSTSTRVEDEAVSSVLDRSVDQLHDVVETLRRYIYQLKSADGLRETLSQQLFALAERMGAVYPTQVNVDLHEDLDLVDVAIAEEVVKLATEILSNALRHSRAEELTLRGRARDGQLSLLVRDDGQGFDPDHVRQGMGLLNMKVRVRRLGGDLSIETAPGSGTTVAIRLPTR